MTDTSKKGNNTIVDGAVLDLAAIDASFESLRYEKLKRHILKRNKKRIKTISAISTVIVFLLGFFTFSIYRYISDLRDDARIADIARDRITASQSTAVGNIPELGYLEETAAAGHIEEHSDDGGVEEPEEPVIAGPRAILSSIMDLREEFGTEDIVGYIRVDGTEIDYMVMQSDNNDYYLDRNVYGQITAAGSVFMDYRNNAGVLGRNTILYAHNMRSGTMFHNLRYYLDRQFFEENRYVYLTTLHDETVWEVVAFYITNIDFNYIQVDFSDDGSYLSLIDEMMGKSFHDSGIDVGKDDLVLTLSTCTESSGGSRYVLHAKLIRSIGVEELEYE